MSEPETDDSDRIRVNLLVDEDVVVEWDEHVGQNAHYQSRSQLIRKSVRQEIARIEAGDTGLQMTESQDSGEVVSAIHSLSKQIGTMDENIDRLREDVNTSAPVELKKVLREVLPLPGELPDQRAGYTPNEIARRIGGDTEEVRSGLAELQGTNPRVHAIEETIQDPNAGRVQRQVYYLEPDDRPGVSR